MVVPPTREGAATAQCTLTFFTGMGRGRVWDEHLLGGLDGTT